MKQKVKVVGGVLEFSLGRVPCEAQIRAYLFDQFTFHDRRLAHSVKRAAEMGSRPCAPAIGGGQMDPRSPISDLLYSSHWLAQGGARGFHLGIGLQRERRGWKEGLGRVGEER